MRIKFLIRDLLWALLCVGMFCGWVLSNYRNSRALMAAMTHELQAHGETALAKGALQIEMAKVQQLSDRLAACQEEAREARRKSK